MFWVGLQARRSLKAPIIIYYNLKYLNINSTKINYAMENKIAWAFEKTLLNRENVEFSFLSPVLFLCILAVPGLRCYAGFSLVAAGATHGVRESHCGGSSCCRAQAVGLSSCGSPCLEHRLSICCSAACRIFPAGDRTCVSCIGRQALYHRATREAQSWTFKRIHRSSEVFCSWGWMDSQVSAHAWNVVLAVFEQSDPVHFPRSPFRHREGHAQEHHTTSLLRSNPPPCILPFGVRSLPGICHGQRACLGGELSLSLLWGHQPGWQLLSINGDDTGFHKACHEDWCSLTNVKVMVRPLSYQAIYWWLCGLRRRVMELFPTQHFTNL